MATKLTAKARAIAAPPRYQIGRGFAVRFDRGRGMVHDVEFDGDRAEDGAEGEGEDQGRKESGEVEKRIAFDDDFMHFS
jgi:hypothetical protein